MTALMEPRETYLSAHDHLEKSSQGDPDFVRKLRHSAIHRFASLGFPTPDDEEWRFTPLNALTRHSFTHASAEDFGSIWTPSPLPEGVLLMSLAQAMVEQSARVEPYLASFAAIDHHAFVALNTAFLREGVFLYIPPGKVVDQPIDLSFLTTPSDNGMVRHRRMLVVADRNSQATLIEGYRGPNGVPSFTNAVTEIVLGEGAVLDHYKVQEEGDQTFHIATMQVHQARRSNFRSHSLTFGGRLVRNDINAVLDGEGCETTLNGLYLASGEQLVDNHTRIDHARPRCASHELYKGILDGKGQGVFNGKIFVHQDAQKTDAKQTNQTLLLSENAVIHTKPQLEIFADDVKCTHGATVGQLDANALFYLQTRGIGRDEARALLTFAFANDLVERILVERLRQRLEERLLVAQNLPLLTMPEESP